MMNSVLRGGVVGVGKGDLVTRTSDSQVFLEADFISPIIIAPPI